MKVQFKTEVAKKAAAELGVSAQDLNFCLSTPDLSECKRRLSDLKARVKKSYRECALRLHPDRTGDDPDKTAFLKEVTNMRDTFLGFEIGPAVRRVPTRTVVVYTQSTGTSTQSTGTSTNVGPTWGGWSHYK